MLAVVGNLVWGLVGVLSISGPRIGTSNMVVSRAQYGFQGNEDFLITLENFLLWSIYWYAPFFGVYVTELIFSRAGTTATSCTRSADATGSTTGTVGGAWRRS